MEFNGKTYESTTDVLMEVECMSSEMLNLLLWALPAGLQENEYVGRGQWTERVKALELIRILNLAYFLGPTPSSNDSWFDIQNYTEGGYNPNE